MSDYKHRMTLVVPELLIPQANQLALIAGESSEDVHTFTNTSYKDSVGNLYAVCSTVIKPIVLSLLSTPIADSPLTAEGADVASAQEAMNKVVMYLEGALAGPDSILINIDMEPHAFFEAVGLIDIQEQELLEPDLAGTLNPEPV